VGRRTGVMIYRGGGVVQGAEGRYRGRRGGTGGGGEVQGAEGRYRGRRLVVGGLTIYVTVFATEFVSLCDMQCMEGV
jgi:hypothetical protein